MNVVAIIPARGGSKGVPGKNLRPVGGIPLVTRAVSSALAEGLVTRVIVSTDDARIASEARSAGAEIMVRPSELSHDEASSESALLNALEQLAGSPDAEPVDILVFIQVTSPFLDAAALHRAIELVRDGVHDVVFSAVETFEFLWTADGAGVNHDPAYRPRRQDREPHYRETGSFYVMDAAGFRASRHRFFGRIGLATVYPETSIEIDSFGELELASAVALLVDGRAGHELAMTAQ